MLSRVGRASSVLAITGWVVVFLALLPVAQSILSTNQALFTAFNFLGALTALAAFVSWFTAIFHWGSRYEGAPGARGRWGVAVILGVFVGAWIYWFKGVPSTA